MKMRDPITTTISIITMLFVALNTTGLLAQWGITDTATLQQHVQDLALAIVGIVLFFARDNDEMKKIPGAGSVTALPDRPTFYERLTGKKAR